MKITIAHTPDPDDSFMFYGMFEGFVKTHYDYEQVVEDIESLNKKSVESVYDITAISANAYSSVHNKYNLLSAGASFGISTGPIVVAKREVNLKTSSLGIPGFGTSAYFLYRFFGPDPLKFVECRFDLIPDMVVKGEIDAGLLIHDEQLTFQKKGLLKVLDLGDLWRKFSGNLPVPLGFNAARSTLQDDVVKNFLDDFRRSIKYGFQHEDDALKYSMKFARYSDIELERKFVRLYVNDLTYDFGEPGKKALELYYRKAHDLGLTGPFTPVIL
ncbi:MAG: ABC transporter substrate-binding protein [Candidatus Thermoplasmatota archaeon]|nr:ABC transporter substrate-binding protein [Candidatus Thermoplasmatota archaeon]MCL5731715.1 ABC transporter substrate-binding protein [Candidatus Thermoplasmatota archaeon]